MQKIDTLLFDLDGTLLPMDMEYFVEGYMKSLAPRFMHLLEPKLFIKHLWAATNAMIENVNPDENNQMVFWRHFTKATSLSREVLEPITDDFYNHRFKELKPFTNPSSIAREIVELANNLGFNLVMATNPLFPAAATLERMNWAGIRNYPWKLITTYENSRFCKPNAAYFQDILDHLNLKPQQCLMIGNDMQEDMCASTLGIHTYLVTDCMIDKGKPQYTITAKGTLAELKQFISEL